MRPRTQTLSRYIPVLASLLAAVVLAVIALSVRPAHAQEAECTKVEVLVTDASDQYADAQAKVYTGEEAKRIIEVARAQSGREDALEGTNGVTVVTSKEAGGGVIAVTKDGCVKLVGRGSFGVIDAILKAAKVGGDT